MDCSTTQPSDGSSDKEKPYEIVSYDLTELRKHVCAKSNNDNCVIESKRIIKYLDGYLRKLGAKKILVENNYIENDYLEDLASYYVKCFSDIPRKCTRLHFFSTDFDDTYFQDSLKLKVVYHNDSQGKYENEKIKNLKDAYLGFIVLKPLPQTVIGRTCLKTYRTENDGKNYPIIRTYEANIFGHTFKVETLAFQEQDHVVAACATSALWCAFHATGKLFQHSIPSPAMITKMATDNLPLKTRAMPNNGLLPEQMAHAISKVGLEPELVSYNRAQCNNEIFLKNAIYAYLQGKIPILLLVTLVEDNRDKAKHAVAVTGYSLAGGEVIYKGVLLRASRIDKIFAHDDQVGPFAIMEFDGEKVKITDKDTNRVFTKDSLSTSLVSDDDIPMRATPYALLIPLHHLIRIPFNAILKAVQDFDKLLESYRLCAKTELVDEIRQRFEWDIFLTTINDFKNDIAKSGDFTNENFRKDILLHRMPRFIWRSIVRVNEKPLFELLFDATGIVHGALFLRPVLYDKQEQILEMFKTLLEIHCEKQITKNQRVVHMLNKLNDELEELKALL
jgi:hypothetical protein